MAARANSTLTFLGMMTFISSALAAWGNDPISPLKFHGKPFFPIGMYSGALDEKQLTHLRQNGCNTLLLQNCGAADHVTPDEERLKEVQRVLAVTQKAGFAVIAGPPGAYPPGAKDWIIEGEKERLTRWLNVVKEFKCVLGYYTFDEPENHYYPLCKGTDFASFVLKEMGWTYDLIKRIDPERYVMPCIAWENMYESLAALYDVNLPNNYPKHLQGEPDADLYSIPYDAHCAAEAVRKTGRTSFCYTPSALDVWGEESKTYISPDSHQLQYMIYAAIAQGAMGIVTWTGWRCTPKYLDAVVLPQFKKLSKFQPWLLGQWMDEKVTVECDTPAPEYLTRLKLPVCSTAVRKARDGSVLLLTVNNSHRTVTVSLRMSVSGLKRDGQDLLSGDKVSMDKGVLKKTLKPFAVMGCLFNAGR